MDTIKLLKKFAQSQGIDVLEVDNFINKIANPQNIDELLELPNDMLKHFGYTSDIDIKVRDYIEEEYSPNRKEVITLDRLSGKLLDDMGYYEYKFEKGEITQEKFDEEIKKYEELLNIIVNNKFGSLKWDW